MKGRFSHPPDPEHGNPLKPSSNLKMSPLFCVCHAHLKRGIRTVRAKNLKEISKNAHSPIVDGRFSDQPDREHGNPLKPAQTRWNPR